MLFTPYKIPDELRNALIRDIGSCWGNNLTTAPEDTEMLQAEVAKLRHCNDLELLRVYADALMLDEGGPHTQAYVDLAWRPKL